MGDELLTVRYDGERDVECNVALEQRKLAALAMCAMILSEWQQEFIEPVRGGYYYKTHSDYRHPGFAAS